MASILDDLAEDHARFRRYLTSYREEIGKMANGESADVRLLELLATYFAQFPDELHHKKEDILYGRLEGKARPGDAPLDNLHEQHRVLSQQANHFAGVMEAVLNDAELPISNIVQEAEEYAAILTQHMQSEEASLFDPVRAAFSDSDWAAVEEALAALYALDINFEKVREVRAIEDLLDAFFND